MNRLSPLFSVLLLAVSEAALASEEAASTNRLIDANDPYLLAHAHNPVDWYPWGPEALEKAKRENKPIFISVGYSTCYWCHVAERTIYSNPEIARLMNDWFINIKVDREEHPDIDALYMLATQLMTGHGGWPNNVFLTPDLKPFFAGSYFPPEDDDFGRPGFPRVLKTLHEAWTQRRADVERKADIIVDAMKKEQRRNAGSSTSSLPSELLARTRDVLLRQVDAEYGGLKSGATKFPNAPALNLLLASRDSLSLATVKGALDAMAWGGIHDHLGGGLHRYSTEPTWSIPHFEKMLYDNAQMLALYAQAWRETRDPLYRLMAEDIAAYVARRLTAPEGGFYSAEDAETNGREGASYVWRRREIEAILGHETARRFFRVYSLASVPARAGETASDDDPEGVLRMRLSSRSREDALRQLAALAPAREKLLAARQLRAQPLRDEKIIMAWNGLMIGALADAGRILDRPEYTASARRAAQALWDRAFDAASGELKHELFRGRAQVQAYLDDYAQFGGALLAVGEATQEPVWQKRAATIASAMLDRFRQGSTLAMTQAGAGLPLAPPEAGDHVMPSGLSAALSLLLQLSNGTGTDRYRTMAKELLADSRVAAAPEQWPTAVAALARHPGSTPSGTALPSSADHVHAYGTLGSTGNGNQIAIKLEVDAGYHINANPASFDYLIPTTISFKNPSGIDLRYPPPVIIHPRFARDGLKVYEGTTTIVGWLPSANELRSSIEAEIRIQACDDETCLPPATLTVVVPGNQR